MKKYVFQILILTLFLFLVACSEETIDDDLKNVFDCELDSDSNFIGICLNGSVSVNPNETLIYASKSSANFSEIQWEIEFGNMQIINIENSLENNLPKSLATIQFNSDFSGGSIKVVAIDNNSNSIAEISDYTIELEN